MNLIVSLLAVILVVKVLENILSTSKFKHIFRMLAGLTMLSCLVLFIVGDKPEISVLDIPNIDNLYTSENAINTAFCERLSDTIENDLHNKFYVNVKTFVKTDMKTLQILIYTPNEFLLKDDIVDFVKSKYCTKNDVVIINNAS